MRSGYIIFILALLVVITYSYISAYEPFTVDELTVAEPFISYTVEGTAAAACAPKTLVKDPVQPEIAQLGVGTVEPSTIVNSLPSTSYVPSRAASMPYRNPGTEPARYIQILSTLQQLQAFFGFEAPAIENECDPTVVLPLQQARSDMAQLLTQVDVLERNPGIPSTITMKELTQITSNLRYLQKEARKFGANTGTELLNTNVSTIENFENAPLEDEEDGEGFASSAPASLAELRAFRSSIDGAISDLKSKTAGTTDAVTLKRLATLDRMRKDVDDIIKKVEDGTIKAEQVPVDSAELKKITANLGSTDEIVGTIIRNVALPPALARLFPSDIKWNDKIVLENINKDINRYMKELTQGLSWKAKGDLGLELKYDSPASVAVAAGTKVTPSATTTTINGYQSQLSPIMETQDDIGGPAKTDAQLARDLNRIGGLNKDGTRKILSDPPAGDFDWKDRAQQICAQIRKRGMKPADFGCVDPAVVSADYSWRGNVKLVCSRLEHTIDPGLPVACGCPPKDWSGFKNN